MAKYKVGDKVVTAVEDYGIPAGTEAVVSKIHWTKAYNSCYELDFSNCPEQYEAFGNMYTWNFLESELK